PNVLFGLRTYSSQSLLFPASRKGGLFHGLITIALFGWVSGHDNAIAHAYRCGHYGLSGVHSVGAP
ncbi:MAG: hypothetical protein VYE16_08415, partial [Cyanobacteriota bacterium]|nr:hypothetical protein [Cyanobacteriota bacterium]